MTSPRSLDIARIALALGAGALALSSCASPPPPAASPPATPTVSTEPPPKPEPVDQAPSPEGCAEPGGCPDEEAALEGGLVAECNRLVEVINREQGPLKEASGSDPAALHRLADVLDEVAGEVGTLPIGDATLRQHRDDYARMARELAVASRQTATALADNDPTKAAEAAKAMSSFGSREADLVAAINRHCAGEAEPEPVASPVSPDAPPPPASVAKGPFPSSKHPAMTKPQLAQGKAPATFKVRFTTTAGDFTVQCRRDWAPHGADRFYSLVAIRYFDDVAFFRAVKDFVVQFGIHGDPAVNQAWQDEKLDPDRVRESNLEGTLTFAQAGGPAAPGMTADSRSTQLFFNLRDNQRLDAIGFAPICRVIQGLEAVKRIHTGHGEKAGRDQSAITKKGNPYLRQTYPELDYIERARIVR